MVGVCFLVVDEIDVGTKLRQRADGAVTMPDLLRCKPQLVFGKLVCTGSVRQNRIHQLFRRQLCAASGNIRLTGGVSSVVVGCNVRILRGTDAQLLLRNRCDLGDNLAHGRIGSLAKLRAAYHDLRASVFVHHNAARAAFQLERIDADFVGKKRHAKTFFQVGRGLVERVIFFALAIPITKPPPLLHTFAQTAGSHRKFVKGVDKARLVDILQAEINRVPAVSPRDVFHLRLHGKIQLRDSIPAHRRRRGQVGIDRGGLSNLHG